MRAMLSGPRAPAPPCDVVWAKRQKFRLDRAQQLVGVNMRSFSPTATVSAQMPTLSGPRHGPRSNMAFSGYPSPIDAGGNREPVMPPPRKKMPQASSPLLREARTDPVLLLHGGLCRDSAPPPLSQNLLVIMLVCLVSDLANLYGYEN